MAQLQMTASKFDLESSVFAHVSIHLHVQRNKSYSLKQRHKKCW